jgi:hypothetical protein
MLGRTFGKGALALPIVAIALLIAATATVWADPGSITLISGPSPSPVVAGGSATYTVRVHNLDSGPHAFQVAGIKTKGVDGAAYGLAVSSSCEPIPAGSDYDFSDVVVTTSTTTTPDSYTISLIVREYNSSSACSGGKLGDGKVSAALQVVGALDHIVVKPNKVTITAGDTSDAYSSTAYDAYDNHWDVTAATTFSIDDGSCDNTAKTCTSKLAGNRTVTGTYEGMTDTAILKVDPAALDHIVVKPNKVTITAGDSASYSSTAYDAYGNHWDVTADTTFSVDGSPCAGATCSSTEAGRHTVTGAYGGKTDTAILKVDPAALDHIVVKPNKATITAGDSASYSSTAYDAWGNHWDVTAATTFSIDDGSCDNTAKTCTSKLAGNRTVTGTYEGMTDTAILKVDPAALNHIVIKPNKVTITAGDSASYTAKGYDAYDNHWDVTADTTFSVDGSPCAGATCSSTEAGRHTVTGTYSPTSAAVSPAVVAVGFTDTAILIVEPGPLASITISPDTSTIAVGDTQGYTAEGFDQYGNSRGDVTGDVIFTINGSGSCSGTDCGSNTADSYTVTGTVDGTSISDSATLDVTSLVDFDHIIISPDTAAIPAGGSQTYTAEAFDKYGTSLADVTAGTIFTIDGSGSSCTGAVCTSTVAATHTVTGTYLGKTDTATLIVGFGGAPVLVVSPNPATVQVGHTQTFTASLFDGYGNFVADVTADVTFTIDAPGACTANVCGSAVAGTYTVTAALSPKEADVAPAAELGGDPVIGTAILTVTAAPATATPTIVIGGASGTPRAATPPPTNTGDGSSGGAPLPLFALLLCSAFGALGLLAVQAQRRAMR